MHFTEYSPASDAAVFTNKYTDWTHRFVDVQVWVAYLAREVQAEDFVAKIMAIKPLEIAMQSSEDNRLFTEDEQEVLLARIDDVERHVIESRQFTTDEAAHVRNEFVLLKQELKRSGRSGWIKMVVGTLVSIGLKFFKPEQVQIIWHFASDHLMSAVQFVSRITNKG